MAVVLHARPVSNWSSGLCDCGQDCVSCCCAYWCPCIVVGQIVEIVSRGTTCGCCPGCLCGGCIFFWIHILTGWTCGWGWGYCYSCCFRAALRQKYGLGPEPCGDYCVDCWCLFCSLAQQHRELKFRGIVPELGFNEANRAAYDAYCAPIQQTMGPVQVHVNNVFSPSINHNENAVVSNGGGANYNGPQNANYYNGPPNIASNVGATHYNGPPNVAKNVGPTHYNGPPNVGRKAGVVQYNGPPKVARNFGANQYNGPPNGPPNVVRHLGANQYNGPPNGPPNVVRHLGANQYNGPPNGPPNVVRHLGANQYNDPPNGPPNVVRHLGANQYNGPPAITRNVGANQYDGPPLARDVAKNIGSNQHNGPP